MFNDEFFPHEPVSLNEKIYNSAQRFYNTGIKYYKTRDFKQARLHFNRALDHFIMYKASSTEKLRMCYHGMAFAWWHLGEYERACDDIGMAVEFCNNSDIENIEDLAGWMWHELIRSHKSKTSQNPYYGKYLLSRPWMRKRDKRKKIDNSKCVCGRGESDMKLHVHHQTYERVGKEVLSDLIILCEQCHEKCHSQVDYQHTWPSYKQPDDLPFRLDTA
jgi:tetratricopeptide (TPR) repeat protein